MSDIEHWTHDEHGDFIKVPEIDKLCQTLKTKFLEQERQNEHLKLELKKITDEKWKDEELQKMKEEMDTVKANARRGFPISKKEYENAMNWINNHELVKHPRPDDAPPRGGAIGGSYTWKFTPTSIGTFGTVYCSCGDHYTFQEEA